jgi:integrase
MARQRYQRGCIFLRGKNPVWIGRYREDMLVADGATPIRVLKSVVLGSKRELPTKRLAERKLESVLSRINAVTYRPGRIATVGDFAERWKAEVLSKRKASTIHAAESHLKNQIIPYLGRLPLDQLGAENLQMFVNKIGVEVSRKTVLNIVGTLSSMLNIAKSWGYICEGVKVANLVLPQRDIREQAHSFTPDQARKILQAASGQYRIMFAIAAMLGLRAGEILGLKSEDFDLEGGLLRIRRTVWRGRLQTPKSINSEATLPVPATLSMTIREFLGDRQGFLFLNSRGHLFIAENVVRQALTPILDALGIPRCGFHAFRHTHSSLLLASGAAPTVAQKQLRHSDARMTLGIYGHIIGDAHREAVEKVASILNPTVPNSLTVTQVIQ